MTPLGWQIAGGAAGCVVVIVLMQIMGFGVFLGFAIGGLLVVWFMAWEERIDRDTPPSEGSDRR